MPILIEILVVLAIVGLGVNHLFRGRRDAERQALMERRVSAYMDTIRRERSNAELVAMNDNELSDLLLSAAHNLKVQSDRRWLLMLGGGLVALIAAIMVATQEGSRGFAIAILIGALAIYLLNEFAARRMREPLIARGIDVERLRVE